MFGLVIVPRAILLTWFNSGKYYFIKCLRKNAYIFRKICFRYLKNDSDISSKRCLLSSFLQRQHRRWTSLSSIVRPFGTIEYQITFCTCLDFFQLFHLSFFSYFPFMCRAVLFSCWICVYFFMFTKLPFISSLCFLSTFFFSFYLLSYKKNTSRLHRGGPFSCERFPFKINKPTKQRKHYSSIGCESGGKGRMNRSRITTKKHSHRAAAAAAAR